MPSQPLSTTLVCRRGQASALARNLTFQRRIRYICKNVFGFKAICAVALLSHRVLLWSACMPSLVTIRSLADRHTTLRHACSTPWRFHAVIASCAKKQSKFIMTVSCGVQLECVLILLRAKAAITETQLDKLLRLIYNAQSSKVVPTSWRSCRSCYPAGLKRYPLRGKVAEMTTTADKVHNNSSSVPG